MPINLVGTQKIDLVNRKNGGTKLTLPDACNGALLRITKGSVGFTIDNTDPFSSKTMTQAHLGQSINVMDYRVSRSIAENVRLISAKATQATVVAWYFD